MRISKPITLSLRVHNIEIHFALNNDHDIERLRNRTNEHIRILKHYYSIRILKHYLASVNRREKNLQNNNNV